MLGIVTEAHGQVLEVGAAVEGNAAVLVEEREATAAALPVAFVGGDEAVGVDPLHAVRLAERAVDGTGEVDHLVLLGVDVLEVDRAGREAGGDLAAGEVDDGDVVVLLEGDHGLIVGVDVDELDLRILRGDGGEAAEVDHLPGSAVDRAVGADGEHGQVAAGKLRDGAVVHLLVALVLDGDRQELAVRRLGERIRLAAKVAGGGDGLGGEVDHGEVAGRVGEGF